MELIMIQKILLFKLLLLSTQKKYKLNAIIEVLENNIADYISTRKYYAIT